MARFERDLGDVIDDVPAESPTDEASPVEPTLIEPSPVELPVDEPTLDQPTPALDEPSLDEPAPWEVAAMTTPDYQPPPSIHDPEHDAWPVEADDGDARPAFSDIADADDELVGAVDDDEIGELLLDEVVPVDPWDVDPEPDDDDGRSDFPLDAFIVPAGVQSVSGYDDVDVAHQVARRLDQLAQQLRDGGLRSLGETGTVDELSRVLASIVTGYVARGG
jgi:hypothetical protein